jgi:hypothetical protein
MEGFYAGCCITPRDHIGVIPLLSFATACRFWTDFTPTQSWQNDQIGQDQGGGDTFLLHLPIAQMGWTVLEKVEVGAVDVVFLSVSALHSRCVTG